MSDTNKRVKQIRLDQKLNQADFGKEIGLSRDAIANIENDRTDVKELAIDMICKVYNVNKKWLMTGDGKMYIEMDQEDKLMAFLGSIAGDEPDSSRKKFMRMLAQLDMDDWDNLDAIMDKMLEHEKPGD